MKTINVVMRQLMPQAQGSEIIYLYGHRQSSDHDGAETVDEQVEEIKTLLANDLKPPSYFE